MDFPNNPVDGATIRLNGQRFIANNSVWGKSNGNEIATVAAGVVDLSKSDVHVLNLSGAAVSVSVINPLASGVIDEFLLEIVLTAATNVTWPASFKWDKGTPPTLPTSGRCVLAGYTRDGGVRFEMGVVSSDSK